MKTTKTIWAPPPNHLHKPRDINRKMVLTLWLTTTALLAAWLACMTLQFTLGGWIHLLLVIVAGMAIATFFYGLRHDEYYERPHPAQRKRKWRFRRHSPSSTSEEEPNGG